MEPNTEEITRRIRALREDMGFTLQEMADATDRTVAEYQAQESGEQGPLLHVPLQVRCKARRRRGRPADRRVSAPAGYSIVRADDGLSVKRRAGFEYLHKAPYLKNKLCEPFVVTAPYLEEEQDKPIHLSRHQGNELDYIISGRLRFAYESHVEELGPGDVALYDSSRGHGMIAIGGEPCVFLAVTIPGPEII